MALLPRIITLGFICSEAISLYIHAQHHLLVSNPKSLEILPFDIKKASHYLCFWLFSLETFCIKKYELKGCVRYILYDIFITCYLYSYNQSTTTYDWIPLVFSKTENKFRQEYFLQLLYDKFYLKNNRRNNSFVSKGEDEKSCIQFNGVYKVLFFTFYSHWSK
jgi:hypothetical protein